MKSQFIDIAGLQLHLRIGGEGAPDLLAEVRGPDGWHRALWLECKEGDDARVSPNTSVRPSAEN